MLRISKLADYACILMGYLARHAEALNAGQIALATHLQLPTVRKLLKALNKAGLLSASRGVQGGYYLARSGTELTLLHIIEAVDGPIAMIDCAHPEKGCEIMSHCPNQRSWLTINGVIKNALSAMPLEAVLPHFAQGE